jgi:hypothetical protein
MVQGQQPDPNDPVFAQYKAAILDMIDAAVKRGASRIYARGTADQLRAPPGLFDALSVRRSNDCSCG